MADVWSFAEKTSFTAASGETPFSKAEKDQILAALQTAYDGSSHARTMFHNWIDTGHIIEIRKLTGAMQNPGFPPDPNGIVELDLNFLKANNSYIDTNGTVAPDTLVTALVHELGHALTGKLDGSDGTDVLNYAKPDYKGDNVILVNQIYKDLGLAEQVSYIAYDSGGTFHKPVGFKYTNGAAIDDAVTLEEGFNDYSKSGNWDSANKANTRDLLIGDSRNNTLQSGGGNDFLVGGRGDDTLNGGADRDTAVYFDTNPADYDIRRSDDGTTWTIKHVRGDGKDATKSDGNDTLQNIESLQFGAQHYELKKSGLTFETDFAFVIDTTGSMGSSIGAVKAQAKTIVDALFANDKIDARVGVVGFKDSTVDSEPYHTYLKFTDDNAFVDRKAKAIAAIDSITVGGGGDTPETDDVGLLHALNGDMGNWRVGAGVHRIALFTDAPVKDVGLRATVEALAANIGATISSHSSLSGSGGSVDTFRLTLASDGSSVAGRSEPSDPNGSSPSTILHDDPAVPDTSGTTLQVYTIFTGPTGTDTSGLADIAAGTGGSFLTAPDNDALVKALLDIINIPPDQTIIGSNGDDTLDGGEGNDFIQGLAGNDILRGHGGIDFLDGGPGADTIDGGDGFDLATWLNESSGLTLNLANQALNAGSALGDTVTNVEAFYLTNFADTFVGGTTGVFVYGFDGNDKITGSSVSDIIDGGPGADTIDAGGGFDYVSYYSSATGVTLDLKNPSNNTGDAKGDVITNAEAYILTSKDDTFVGTDSGQNIVFGYEGNDTLKGGFNANNWFFAGDGNDRMVGGGVQDLFVGGNGADTIVLATPKPIAGSSIFGFTPGTDVLEISRAAFGLSAGYAVTAGSTLVSGTGPVATTTQPTFFYYTNLGLLYFDPDGTGSTAATLLAQFDTHPALTAADFHLV
jgi:Ca2+-binding RTX toxin-like protein